MHICSTWVNCYYYSFPNTSRSLFFRSPLTFEKLASQSHLSYVLWSGGMQMPRTVNVHSPVNGLCSITLLSDDSFSCLEKVGLGANIWGFLVPGLKGNLMVYCILQFVCLGSLSLHRIQTLINVMLLLWSSLYPAMFSVSVFADKAFSTSLWATSNNREEQSHNDRPLSKQLIC